MYQRRPHLLQPPYFFFPAPATSDIYTLSLHDALPISRSPRLQSSRRSPRRNGRATTPAPRVQDRARSDRKSTRLNSSHITISYAVFCLKKKTKDNYTTQSTSPPAPPAAASLSARIA